MDPLKRDEHSEPSGISNEKTEKTEKTGLEHLSTEELFERIRKAGSATSPDPRKQTRDEHINDQATAEDRP